jgi:small subunit ribosomal protein S20
VANTKSAEKAARQAEKHREHNVTLRSRMRTAIRKVNDAVAKGSKEEADRHKSRLAARVKSVST